MIVIAHAGHWAFGLLEGTPVLIVAVAALWKTHAERTRLRRESDATPQGHTSVSAKASHA